METATELFKLGKFLIKRGDHTRNLWVMWGKKTLYVKWNA